MRRLAFIVTVAFMLAVCTQTGSASGSVDLDRRSARPGESVTISGTSQPDSNIVVKITDEDGNIVFFDAANAGAAGGWSLVFTVPQDMTEGKLTVVAGSGADVASAVITVARASATATPGAAARSPSPASTPSPTDSATLTAIPTATPALTPSPAATPTPSAPATAPSPSPAQTPVILSPVAVRNGEAGAVTVGIAVGDLPGGAFAVRTPGGRLYEVKDAVDGVLWVDVPQEDISSGGAVELVVLDGEQAVLAMVRVPVDGAREAGKGAPALLWWFIGGVPLLLTALLIIRWAVSRKNRKLAAKYRRRGR